MRVLVSGAGHGGTCLLATLVRGLDVVRIDEGEDRAVFEYKVLAERYGAKLVTCNPTFSLENIMRIMRRYSDLHIVFSIRHPLDIFMSKIVRGQKPSNGGDGDLRIDVVSADGTVDSALTVIAHFYDVYKGITTRFPERVLVVRLEDLILMPEKEVRRVAKFLKAEPTSAAFVFYKANFNKYQMRRYGTKLDVSTINIHRSWDTWNDGFFKNREDDIRKASNYLANIIRNLGYKL